MKTQSTINQQLHHSSTNQSNHALNQWKSTNQRINQSSINLSLHSINITQSNDKSMISIRSTNRSTNKIDQLKWIESNHSNHSNLNDYLINHSFIKYRYHPFTCSRSGRHPACRIPPHPWANHSQAGGFPPSRRAASRGRGSATAWPPCFRAEERQSAI